ncbi:copper-exporting P-type ATPase A [Gottschalkia purinilytica]|uniref:Copper-exporting P-type ATPase A n=1 Tax=Gottschalkia purinilytica TaxID=1503 RepID=A0A0L0WA47_GOTPU|nr:heavy metal translocating P-type ATPase [Gottschalkia purinilytica]KNF08190.1 copper-exporting P-type ATPase A [Gottschalkia purinilytica]
MGEEKKDILLQGLNCASCAAKIENEVMFIEGVENVTLNFVSSTLSVEYEDGYNFNTIFNEVKSIVKRLEPHVKVKLKGEIENHSHDHSHDHGHDHGESNSKLNYIRFGLGAILLFLTFVVKMNPNLRAGLLLTSYVLVGGDVILRAVKNIARGQVFDENFLMGIATIGAIAIKEYPEAVAVMLFYQVGELFQGMAINRSRKSIKSLLNIRPDYANLKVGSELNKVNPEKVNIGDIIVVKPGEKVPLDGKVIEGNSMVNTSALTGESVPRSVNKGDEILSGFVNENGLLTVEVTKRFSESTVSKILDLVENASNKKAPTENFITKFARYYTPVVVILAALIAIIPPLALNQEFSEWTYRALVFLVISCPCALVVSIPLGFFGGIGAASKAGILIKGGNYLEALNDVDTVVMDKTGTLTKGVFKVREINTNKDLSKDELLRLSAIAEVHSNHPIAKSIKEEYGKEIKEDIIESYEEISGHGIKVKIEGKEVLVGNSKLMTREKIDFEKVKTDGTIVYVAIDGNFAGNIIISDEIKEDAHSAIDNLKKVGVERVIMLTGDTKEVAESVAKELKLDGFYAELLPDGKVEKVEELYRQESTKGKLAFVGDGINDAPVLARADIGVAMGGLGSDAAIEAADVVLMTDEPTKLATSIRIARKTKKIVIQNIVLSLGIKAVVLALGAFGIATMWEAVFADVGVTLIAVLNSMRALRVD